MVPVPSSGLVDLGRKSIVTERGVPFFGFISAIDSIKILNSTKCFILLLGFAACCYVINNPNRRKLATALRIGQLASVGQKRVCTPAGIAYFRRRFGAI